MNKGGIVPGLPGRTEAQHHQHNTLKNSVIWRLLLIGIASLVYTIFFTKLDISRLLNKIKNYICYPLWNLITYSVKWTFGYIPKVDIPEETEPSIDIASLFSTNTDKENTILDENDCSKDELPDDIPEFTDEISETEALNKGRKYVANSLEAKKNAYRQGRKQSIRKYKTMGAASITAQEIAAAHAYGRQEIIKQHKILGAKSITQEEAAAAKAQGRKEALKQQHMKGIESVTQEEATIEFNNGREQQQKEEFTKGLEATAQIKANAQDASHIAQLRMFINQIGDIHIVEKAMFRNELDQCLQKAANPKKCVDTSIALINLTQPDNILSENSPNKHVGHALTLLKQMREDIPYKKWFCDVKLECQNHKETDCLEKAQTITGMHYENDDFCPPV